MSRSMRFPRALVLVSLVTLCLVGLAIVTARASQPSTQQPLASAASLPAPIVIDGDPLRIVLGADSSVQVYYDGTAQVCGWQDPAGASADSGAWLWLGDDIYGPDVCFEDRVLCAMYNVFRWTRVSHSGPRGTGTEGDPWLVTTVLDAGTTGVWVTQTVSYVNGQDYFGLQWDVTNSSPASQTVDLFHANDCSFGSDSMGLGYYDASTGAVGGVRGASPWYILFVPDEEPPTAYQEGSFGDIWDAIGYCGENYACPVTGPCAQGPGFDNSINAGPAQINNAFGLQWRRTLAAGGKVTLKDWWTFGTVPVIPGQATPTPSPTNTPTHTPSATLTPAATATATPSATATPIPTLTHTPASTSTRTPVIALTPTVTPGCGDPADGRIARTLVYHQLTSHGPEGVWTTWRGAMLSADGRRAAYAVGSDPVRFYVMNADGSGLPEQVDARSGREGIHDVEVDISADGSRVITIGRDGDYWIVWAVNADGSDHHPLIVVEGRPMFRLSGDGSEVFFQVPNDFSLNDRGYVAGLYAVGVDDPGQVRKIVDREDVAILYGEDVFMFAGGDSNYFGASRDGTRFIFSVKLVGDSARILRVNGDGSGLAEYFFQPGYFWSVPNVGISGDGNTVFYVGWRSPCCLAPYELAVMSFFGHGRTALGGYGNPSTDGALAQLSYDGSRLYYVGTLYDTDGSGRRVELAIQGLTGEIDPPSIVNRYGLYGASMDDSATRFLYRADYGRPMPQLATLELDPASLGPAPAITAPRIEPPYVLADGSSEAMIRVHVSTGQTLVRVNSVSLRGGLGDTTVTWAILRNGDGVYSGAMRAIEPAPTGARQVRIRAEVRASNGKRHSTAIDVGSLAVTNLLPMPGVTCTPWQTPTRTRTPTLTPTAAPRRSVYLPLVRSWYR